MHSGTGAIDPRHALRVGTALAVATLAIGMAMLLVYSLVDDYGIGRLPWMGIIEGLVVAGATFCVLLGATTVLALGGWLRRLLVLPPLAMAGLWWFLAWGLVGVSGGACVDCSARPFDPWAYAYSAPVLAFQMLVLPAVALALLALTIPVRGPRSHPRP